MKFLGRKLPYGHSYTPADDEAFDKSRKVPPDEYVVIEYVRGRNYPFLQKFMVMTQIAFDNLPEKFGHFKNKDELRKALIFEAGHYNIRKDMKGNVVREPKSISYDSIPDDIEFEQIYNDVLDIVYAMFDSEFVDKHLINF